MQQHLHLFSTSGSYARSFSSWLRERKKMSCCIALMENHFYYLCDGQMRLNAVKIEFYYDECCGHRPYKYGVMTQIISGYHEKYNTTKFSS